MRTRRTDGVPVPPEVESLVAGAPVSAHVATSVDDRPHVAPVWYGYRDGVLYFVTGGKKLENVRRNPRVALSIEDARGGDVAWNVTLLGRATVSEDPRRIEWATDWIYDAYEDGDEDSTGEVGSRGSDDGAGSNGSDEVPGTRSQADGGDEDGAASAYALVEVEIGSASWAVYE